MNSAATIRAGKACFMMALLATFSIPGAAQLPPGVTPEMIASSLPEQGAPKAVPGPYAVTSGPATGADGLKVFHPRDLSRFRAQDTLPVVVWGNGGCAIDGPRYAGLLETIASHGFLVITTTASANAVAQSGPPPRATAASLAAGIDWATGENQRAGSPLAGRIAIDQVAVMGQSCGGRLSIELGADPRVDTIGVFNAGLQPEQMGLLARLHGPVLLINGHERDFMFGPSKATYEAIDKLPAFYGARHGAGHTATAYHAGGGEFANVASNWLRWQFKNDAQARAMFAGEKCGLCTNPDWDAAGKRLGN
jgi:dienelactone hydrolase